MAKKKVIEIDAISPEDIIDEIKNDSGKGTNMNHETVELMGEDEDDEFDVDEVTDFESAYEVCAVAPGAFRTDFRDASSMHFLKKPMPEYDGTPAHTMIDWLKENNHKQMGDPEKATGFLYKTAEKQKLPQILTIGKDCSDASLKHYKKIIEDMESYYDDSCKTSFED